MLMETEKTRRVPVHSVVFSDARGDVKGFAADWFFWVHEAFKPALDIRFVERLDVEKTRSLREKKSLELSGMAMAELKRKAQDDRALEQQFTTVMATNRKVVVETEGLPPLFSFRETDSIESRCGRWYVSVSQATSDEHSGSERNASINQGSVGFTIFTKSTDLCLAWQRHSWLTLTQREFVLLLKEGRCDAIDLTVSAAARDLEQGSLFN